MGENSEAPLEDSVKNIEEEVGRVVEQAKELQDSAASFISKTSSDEQSLRHRALSLDSSIRRLRTLLHSLLSHNLLQPKIADKAIHSTGSDWFIHRYLSSFFYFLMIYDFAL